MQKLDEFLDEGSRNAGKRAKTTEPDSMDQITNVYIWDMDETLILLKSLLNGAYAKAFNCSKDVQKGVEIGKKWEKLILQICDDYFYYEQIEDYDQPFLEALSKYDDGRDLSDYDFSKDSITSPSDDVNKKKLAYRHRAIARKYEQGLHKVLDQEMMKSWNDLYDLTDNYTDKWLSSARTFLEQISGGKVSNSHLALPNGVTDSFNSKPRNLNVLVTSGSLIPSLVKCMLYRLDDLIMHENVYSSWDQGKLQCFQWIKERFGGPNVRFCVIGDGGEECEASLKMKWPFVQIDHRPGDYHRFPGLTLRTLGHYIDVVYDKPDAGTDKKS